MNTRHIGIGLLASLLACAVSPLSVQASVPTPRKVIAISQQQPSTIPENPGIPGTPSDSVLFFDVTDIGNDPNASSLFNSDPLFSVWMGYEIFDGNLNDAPDGQPTGNREDFSALTFNPANGTIYVAAFDSNAPGVPDDVGDTQGDFDLIRIDYQAILADFEGNSRPKGTIYAPEALDIRISDETFMRDNGSIYYDGTIDGKAHDIPHPSDPSGSKTVNLPGSFTKIGEVGRSVHPGAPFFDHELDFVNPETLVLLDANTGDTDSSTEDFTIKTLNRVSTSQGNANQPPLFPPPPEQEGGWNSPNNSQSWESRVAGHLQLDTNVSNPTGWALVNIDGTLGVWAADDDGGVNGDDVAFYKLDLSDPNSPTATRQLLSNSNATDPNNIVNGIFLSTADNPSIDPLTDDGDVNGLMVDKNGNLVFIENGFFDTDPNSTAAPTGANGNTAEEPKLVTIGINDYDNGGVVTTSSGTGFSDAAAYFTTNELPVTPGADPNDSAIVRSDRIAMDRSTGFVYIMDRRNNFREDIYVFDPATGTIVYSEINPFDVGITSRGNHDRLYTRRHQRRWGSHLCGRPSVARRYR